MVERDVVAEPRSFEWSLRRMMRTNLERDIMPCTTRSRRPSDKKYGEYYFVEDEFFNMCEDQLTMIDHGEYNGILFVVLFHFCPSKLRLKLFTEF